MVRRRWEPDDFAMRFDGYVNLLSMFVTWMYAPQSFFISIYMYMYVYDRFCLKQTNKKGNI